jgi:hypothetical protein
MVRSVNHLKRFEVAATDGRIGSIDDVLFDDERWAVRYVVVDTGTWLPGRRVLISPISITHTAWDEQRLLLSISREQVRDSPPIDTHKPVSRREELQYLAYYGYPHYWGQLGMWGAYARPMVPPPEDMAQYRRLVEEERKRAAAKGDTHLRSTGEVTGYVFRAIDGDLGHVDDLLIDDQSWAVRYLVLDTSNWWFGRHVLVAPSWISAIDWAERTVQVSVSRQTLKSAPPYDRAEHVDKQWEADYLGYIAEKGGWLDADEARAIKEAQRYLTEDERHEPDPLERRSRPR